MDGIGCRGGLLVGGCWLAVISCWLLVVGCWLWVVGWRFSVVGCWLNRRAGDSSTLGGVISWCHCERSEAKKNPDTLLYRGLLSLAATYSPTFVVPSALMGLTSLFGMGRGGPHCNSHLKIFTRILT